MIATWHDVAAIAPGVFALGAAAGFIVGARFRIERRNRKGER